ncbi:MAG: hypothetical protein ACE5DL_00340 [Nitrosopumilaceae archaeon]
MSDCPIVNRKGVGLHCNTHKLFFEISSENALVVHDETYNRME